MTTRPLESLALLVADLQRRVVHWRRLYRNAVGALQEKTIECENYRDELDRAKSASETLLSAWDAWSRSQSSVPHWTALERSVEALRTAIGGVK